MRVESLRRRISLHSPTDFRLQSSYYARECFAVNPVVHVVAQEVLASFQDESASHALGFGPGDGNGRSSTKTILAHDLSQTTASRPSVRIPEFRASLESEERSRKETLSEQAAKPRSVTTFPRSRSVRGSILCVMVLDRSGNRRRHRVSLPPAILLALQTCRRARYECDAVLRSY